MVKAHRMARRLGSVIVLIIAVAGSISSRAQDQRLSPEGQARKAAHEFLFGKFSEGKRTKFLGSGPDRVLDEIVISEQRIELRDEVRIELPPGTERVAGMFRYLELRGEGLDHLDGLTLLPYAPNAKMAVSTHEPDVFRVKVGTLPVPDETLPPIVLASRCAPGQVAVVTEIALKSQGKLSVQFDDIPYRNLGADQPPEPVSVVLDIEHEWSIGGRVELDRSRYFRYYGAPGNLHSSFERWAAARGFLPGRQILKLQPAFVHGYSPQQPKLQPRADRPGAADLSFFDRYDSGAALRNTIPEFRGIRYAMCLNDYPEFLSVPQVGRGTPLPEHFADAGELAAAAIADQIADAGTTATWWELKNESTIKAEWDYHWRKGVDSWKLLADFHNTVADAIHHRVPQVRVGGPTSAWMQLHVNDFELYRNQARFMDFTRGHLDFYSHHFYEDIGTLGAWERRQGRYTNYLLGRLEATLDLLRAHMHETDNVRPMLITECGSLQPGRAASDYWLRIRSWNAYLNKLMQRPDQIDLVVPFAFLSIPWNPTSGDAAFVPRPGKPNNAPLPDCEATPVTYFFELWRDFEGRRLPAKSEHPWLDVTAVHQGHRIHVALTNMGGRRLTVDLSALPADRIQGAWQRQLFYWDGEVHYRDGVPVEDLRAVPVHVEETTVVTIELDRPLSISGVRRGRRVFAAGTATAAGEHERAEFAVDLPDWKSAYRVQLVVGVFREGGLAEPLSLRFNGHEYRVGPQWAVEMNHLFAPLRVDVPVEQLQRQNQIQIQGQPGLTITSVHLLVESAP